MKRILIYTSLLVCSYLVFSASCMRMRWSDKKAYSVFKSRNVSLSLRDTLIKGRRLHYAINGNDSLPTLVFIHGSPGSWFHYMKYMYDSSLQRKFRMVSIDRPGFGYSDFGKAMHLQEQCEIILPLLEMLKTTEPMFLFGHSMGGPVVAQLAADNPELFHTIIVAAGAIDPALEKKEIWRHLMKNRPLYWFLPGAFGPSNTELLYLKDDLKPLAADLDKIRCHVIFVHGDKDTWVPIENIQYGKQKMVNAASIRSDTIFGAAHQIPWKNRNELKDILVGLY